MQALTPNVDDLLARLESADLALGSARDVLHTDRAQADYWARKREMARLVNGLRNAPNDLTKPTRLLAEAEERRAVAIAAAASIEAQVASFEDPSTIDDATLRAKEFTRQRDIRRSLELLRAGRLFKAPGECYEPVDYLDTRIAELRARIEVVRARFDEQVRAAEQLLGVEVAP